MGGGEGGRRVKRESRRVLEIKQKRKGANNRERRRDTVRVLEIVYRSHIHTIDQTLFR